MRAFSLQDQKRLPMRTDVQLARLERLVSSIKERNGKPINAFVVIATIESFGVREGDVQEDYGFEGIQELGIHIFEQLNTSGFYGLKNQNQVTAEHKEYKRISINAYITGRTGLFVKDYTIGIIHLLPVAIQIAAVILFGFSLWTFVGFNNLQSTAVVLGVILGLVATGGFVQATGKQVSFYWYNQDYQMTYRVIKQLFALGLKIIGVTFIVIAIINSFVRLFPFLFVAITFMYALLIGALLLALAPLYTIKRRWMISIAVSAGTILTLLLHWYTSINTYLVHWIGILTGIAICIIFLYYFFQKKMQGQQVKSNQIPRTALAIYRNINYFLYGTFIYVFVFMDRIIAWSSNTGRELPYIIYYESRYEIGMDLAILVFFLLAGVMEYSISSFSRFLEYHQRTTRFTNVVSFNAKMLQHYKNHLAIFSVSAVIIFALLYLVLHRDWGYSSAFSDGLDPLSLWVCAVGSVGYLFLTLGMLNVLYLYTLNRHKRPVLFIGAAMIVNLILGIALSRWISYEYAALGMMFGSLTFALLSTAVVIKFFRKLDYYYYAAF